MYQEHVLNHYGEPYHKGLLPTPEGSDWVYEGNATSAVCGDTATIQARVEAGVIVEIWWQGEGCCFAQAAASMLVEYTEGKTVGAMRNFTEYKMFELFKVECPSLRRGCVLVALNALQNLLRMCP